MMGRGVHVAPITIQPYSPEQPSREDIDGMSGAVLLDFGTNWCPICQAFAPQLAELLLKYPTVKHLKVEDGKARRLGRSFRVKLWPNLVFLLNGRVVAQHARPDISEAEASLRFLTKN